MEEVQDVLLLVEETERDHQKFRKRPKKQNHQQKMTKGPVEKIIGELSHTFSSICHHIHLR